MASSSALAMSAHERFLFDLNGFIVVRNVLSEPEVEAANAAIDAQAERLCPRDSAALRNTRQETPFAAAGPRVDIGGMLQWPQPHCEPFRRLLAHPRLVPYLTELCGEGYRLDHQPLVIAQEQDSEGFHLHGGPVTNDGRMNPELQYRCFNGQLWTSLLAFAVQLSDHGPGDGGFCIVRGSHKVNLPVPDAVAHGTATEFWEEHLYRPVTRRGDVVIWSEATVHGATPWRGAHQRRIALYRFAPPTVGYGRGYTEVPDEVKQGMRPLERAVLEPPYATRLERPLVTAEAAASAAEGGDAQPAKKARSDGKKDFDRKLFGTSFF
jgi:ectoine hydroxylase-related dioxygenase (phytanoyl-CoA dioxygenase family)